MKILMPAQPPPAAAGSGFRGKNLFMGFLFPAVDARLESLCPARQTPEPFTPRITAIAPGPIPPAMRSVSQAHQERPMSDVLMLAIGLGFFALAVGYGFVCGRL